MEDFDFDDDSDMIMLRTTFYAYCEAHATCNQDACHSHERCCLKHPDICVKYVQSCHRALAAFNIIRHRIWKFSVLKDKLHVAEHQLESAKRTYVDAICNFKLEQAVFKGDLVAARPDSSKKRKRLPRKCKK